jgi:predicted urease superfamily metal-dependent hydrolase
MASVTITPKKTVRSKRRPKAKPMTNVEIFQKIIADQKFIRDAIQSGVTFQKLKDKYGYKFATV